MNLTRLLGKVKQHPGFDAAGMVLIHNGVVRKTTRQGTPVTGLRVAVDTERLAAVLAKNRQKPGIVDIQVEIAADQDLKIGEDVMFLIVAGDIRENVIAVLRETLEEIKSNVTRKTEFLTGT